MTKRKVKIKRKKSKSMAVIFIFLAVLIAGGIYLGIKYLPSDQADIDVQAPDFTEAEAYLKNAGIDIALVEKVTFTGTNPTDKALAGSAVTYWVEVTGLDNAGNIVSKKIEDVTVAQDNSAGSDIKFLRDHTIAILDQDIANQILYIKVSFGSLSHTFHYSIVHQSVSTDNLGVLVNRYTGVGRDYKPASLAKSEWIHYTNGYASTVSNLDTRANTAIEEMFTAAKADGITLYNCSGYRPYSMQESLYNEAVASLGPDQNDTAPPGHSEHQTGLAMDITCPSVGGGLTQRMENTEEYDWLIANSYKYGFVLRYTKGYEDVTGYMFEPWHYRYIGKELAALYHSSGMPTLDEFLSIPR